MKEKNYMHIYWFKFHCNLFQKLQFNCHYVEGIRPKGPYPPCLCMADRALLAGYPRLSQHWFGKWLSFKHKASHYLRQWWCSSVMHICNVRPQQIKWGSVSASVVSVLFCKKILIHFDTFSIGILNNENSYSGETDEHVYTVTNPSWICIGIQYICCPSYGNH